LFPALSLTETLFLSLFLFLSLSLLFMYELFCGSPIIRIPSRRSERLRRALYVSLTLSPRKALRVSRVRNFERELIITRFRVFPTNAAIISAPPLFPVSLLRKFYALRPWFPPIGLPPIWEFSIFCPKPEPFSVHCRVRTATLSSLSPFALLLQSHTNTTLSLPRHYWLSNDK